MNVFVAIAIVIVTIGATYIQVARKDGETATDHAQDIPEPQVLGKEATDAPTTSPTHPPIPTSTLQNTPTNIPPTSPEQKTSNALYPNAIVVSTTDTSVFIESSDSPALITDWYKSYIRSQGMNTISFVTTSTNGSVHNKLVAAGDGKEIRITIRKEPDNKATTIEIEQ